MEKSVPFLKTDISSDDPDLTQAIKQREPHSQQPDPVKKYTPDTLYHKSEQNTTILDHFRKTGEKCCRLPIPVDSFVLL
jgi:hypothetical protein